MRQFIIMVLLIGISPLDASQKEQKLQELSQCLPTLLRTTPLPPEICHIIAEYDEMRFLNKISVAPEYYIGDIVAIGDYIACAYRAGSYDIQIFHSNDFKHVHTLPSPVHIFPSPTCIRDLIKLSEQQLVSCALNQKAITFWNIVTKKRRVLKTARQPTCLVTLSEQLLAAGYDSGNIRIYSAGGDLSILSLLGHTDSVCCLTKLSSQIFASGSKDCSIKLWNSATGTCIHSLTEHTNWVTNLLKLSERTFASASIDGIIKAWDIRTYTCIYTLPAHTNWISCLMNVSDSVFASGSHDRTVKLWDSGTGACIQILSECSEPVQSIVCLPNKLVACANNSFFIWDYTPPRQKNSAKVDEQGP